MLWILQIFYAAFCGIYLFFICTFFYLCFCLSIILFTYTIDLVMYTIDKLFNKIPLFSEHESEDADNNDSI